METIGAKTLNFIPSALARLGGLACAIQRKCSSSSLPHPRLEHATVGGQEGLGLRGLCSRKSDKPDAVSWFARGYRVGSLVSTSGVSALTLGQSRLGTWFEV